MTTQLTPQSRSQYIRNIFDNLASPMSVPRFCHWLLDNTQVFPEEVRFALAFAQIQEEVRRALRAKDKIGLPMCGPTGKLDEDGQQLWKQRPLWDTDDYGSNIKMHLEQANEELDIARKLSDECFDRYHGRYVITIDENDNTYDVNYHYVYPDELD